MCRNASRLMLILLFVCATEGMGHGTHPLLELRQRTEEAQHRHDEDSLNAALRLAMKEDARGTEVLIELLNSKFSDIRSRAAVGLGKTRDQRAVKPLIAALADEAEIVRREASRGTNGVRLH